MHIITKAMKLFSFPVITLLFINVVLQAQVPTDWVLGTNYDSSSLVSYGGTTYRALKDVPGSVGGYPNTLIDYWINFLKLAPGLDHNTSLAYPKGITVKSGDLYYESIATYVPIGVSVSNTNYWEQTTFGFNKDEVNNLPNMDGIDFNSSNLTPPEDNSSIDVDDVVASGLPNASNEAFVMQQYLDFLGRDGDSDGITFWKGELDNGTLTRADCVNSFVFSEEFQAKVAPVSRIYLAYFLRIPDTGGLEFWINEKLAGKTISDISDSFAASTEFQNTYGSLNNADFVNLVYTNLFNRAADSGGFSFWKGQLDNGIDSRGTVMESFSESQENITLTESNIRVISFYYGMLRRAPDQGGYDFWVNELKIGKSPNDLINGFITSAEYQQRF